MQSWPRAASDAVGRWCPDRVVRNIILGHPGWLRCSSLKYAQYSHSSRLAIRAPRSGTYAVVIRKHDYLANSSTGWHMHPGPVFITVVTGQLTFYDYDDSTCTPHVVTAGHGYVDTGHGHIGRNETAAPAQDISVILAPVGGAFRSELSAPGPYCNF